ncbi:hypothetical protein [Winogradskyella sp.]|uniref:hypothetical protein n=1 Tax=Winogradskyella sp. TaxID=1883156 RepID=UPI0026101193|nr:hypothetical protein [Winogradskyella sp.]
MKFKNLLPLLVLILVFNCSSDSDSNDDNPSDNPGDNPGNTVLIEEIIYNYVSDDDVYIQSFSYDGNKLLSILDSEPDSDDTYEATFEYTNDRITRIDNYVDGELMEYVTLEYGTDGILSSFTVFIFDIDGENVAIRNELNYEDGSSNFDIDSYRGDFTSQTEFSGTTNYTVQNGNISSSAFPDTDSIESFQYDTKNSVYKNISQIETIILVFHNTEYGFDIYGANNNITQLDDDQGGIIYTETFEYTYNSDDYPVSAMYYDDGVLDVNVEFSYQLSISEID